MVATMQHTQDAPSWIWSPLHGVRWTTVVTWVVLFALVSWRLRNPIKGFVAAMAWLSGYEILYQATGSVLHGWSLETLMFTTTGTTGWLIATYLFGIRPSWAMLGVFVVLWGAWIGTGYHSNMPDRIIGGANWHWSWADEMLNVSTKTVLALTLAVGLFAHRDVHQHRAHRRADRPAREHALLSDHVG